MERTTCDHLGGRTQEAYGEYSRSTSFSSIAQGRKPIAFHSAALQQERYILSKGSIMNAADDITPSYRSIGGLELGSRTSLHFVARPAARLRPKCGVHIRA